MKPLLFPIVLVFRGNCIISHEMVTFFIFIVIVSAAVTLVSGGAPIRSSSSAVVVSGSRGNVDRGAPNDLDVTSYLPALTTEYGAADILLDDSEYICIHLNCCN